MTDTELLDMMHTTAAKPSASSQLARGLLACLDAAFGSNNNNDVIALVRPPGHHACQLREMGFCFVNSVIIGAKYAIAERKTKKVAILDWDVHDGNGAAEATWNGPNIFRIDIHRFNKLEPFCPCTESSGHGPPQDSGHGKARGLNLNMA